MTKTSTDATIDILNFTFVILFLKYSNDVIDSKDPVRLNANTSIKKNSPSPSVVQLRRPTEQYDSKNARFHTE